MREEGEGEARGGSNEGWVDRCEGLRVNGNSLAEGPDAFVRYAFLEKGSSFARVRWFTQCSSPQTWWRAQCTSQWVCFTTHATNQLSEHSTDGKYECCVL